MTLARRSRHLESVGVGWRRRSPNPHYDARKIFRKDVASIRRRPRRLFSLTGFLRPAFSRFMPGQPGTDVGFEGDGHERSRAPVTEPLLVRAISSSRSMKISARIVCLPW